MTNMFDDFMKGVEKVPSATDTSAINPNGAEKYNAEIAEETARIAAMPGAEVKEDGTIHFPASVEPAAPEA